MKKQTIKGKFLKQFILYVIGILIISLGILFTIDNIYIKFKIEQANNLVKQEKSEQFSELSEGLYELGFMETENYDEINIEDYAQESNKNRYGNYDIYTFNKYVAIKSNDNTTVIFEVNQLLIREIKIFSSILIIFFILMILIIEILNVLFINRLILNRIMKISNVIDNEQKLLALEFSLEDELSEMLRLIQKAIFKNNSELDNRKNIMEALSHELKNPLMKINAILFLANYKNESIDIVKKKVNTQVEAANLIVEAALDVIDAQDDEICDIQVNEIISSKVSDFNVMLKEKNLDISIIENEIFTVTGNVLELNILCSNIITNMIKHGDEGSQLEIEVNQNQIKFSNPYSKQEQMKLTGGSKIVNYLSVKNNLQLNTIKENRKYVKILRKI